MDADPDEDDIATWFEKESGAAAMPESIANGQRKRSTNDYSPKRNGHSDKILILDPSDPMATARELRKERFTDSTTGLSTIIRHKGGFWEWTGSYWRLVVEEQIKSAIWQFLDGCSRAGKEGKPAPFKPNKTAAANTIEALMAVSQLSEAIESPVWLNGSDDNPPPSEFFACASGLLHLPTGEMWPASPNFFGTSASKVIFDPMATPPRDWLRFLDDLFGDDLEAIQLLQEWFGYLLSADTSQQKILLMIGPKRCGKGTVGRVLRALLGHDSVVGPTISNFSESFGLESLITAKLAIVSDARIGGRTDKSAIVERLLTISGEDTITINRKYRQAWTGRLPTRISILTNPLLALSDESGALAGRFLVLQFTKSFYGHEDPALTNKLLAELTSILNWAIGGYCRLNERAHFVQPKSAAEAQERIEMLGAPVLAFVEDCCEVGPGYTVSVDSIFIEYQAWTLREGIKDAGSKAWFGRNIMAAVPGVKISRPAGDEGRIRTYEGIRLQ